MKELKRRGMTPTSLLEEGKRGAYELGEKEMEEAIEEDVVSTGRKKKRNGVVLDDKGVVNQRKVSMALNSEGLEVGSTRNFFEINLLLHCCRLLFFKMEKKAFLRRCDLVF